jgi:CheY-like chemotaxis protein
MPSSHTPWPPLSVLVVDDSADTAHSLADLLRLYGHAVRVELDGHRALLSAERDVPDVVFLDICMPGLDGFQVAESLRSRCGGGKQPLVIAVTGAASETDRLRSAGAGFDLHLVKPVDPGILVGMMERFRRLLAPSIPAADVTAQSGDRDGDDWGGASKSAQYGVWFARSE